MAIAVIGAILSIQYEEVGEYKLVPQEMPVHYNGDRFAGSSSCIPCHKNIYQTHVESSHYNSSTIVNGQTLKNHFDKWSNQLELTDVEVEVARDEQTYVQNTYSKTTGGLIDKSNLDVVIGSGVKGQSYLTFKGDSLFQLQASYFRLIDSWINSPGFPNHKYSRPVTDNCIKCHVTFAKNKTL